jgi:hypothetical protein
MFNWALVVGSRGTIVWRVGGVAPMKGSGGLVGVNIELRLECEFSIIFVIVLMSEYMLKGRRVD